MLSKVIAAFKTRPFFYIFLIACAISIAFSQIYVNITHRNKSTSEKSVLYGEIYCDAWNSGTDLILKGKVKGKNARILLKCNYISDEIFENIQEKGYVVLNDVTLTSMAIAGNFNEFDYCKYLKSHGVDYVIYLNENMICDYAEAGEITIVHSFSFYSWKIRSAVEKSLYRYLDDDTAALVSSVMTGDTGKLDKTTKNYLSNSGFSHLVAVSGAHIAFISKPFGVLTKRSFLNLGKRHAILLIPIFALWFIAGASCSVTRAAFMCGFACVGTLLKRKNDALNGLGIVGIIQLTVNPFCVFSSGFLLSYGSTIAILTILPIIKKSLRKSNKFIDKCLPGIAVNLGILPITMYLFNSFSPCGIILNMFAAEIAGAVCVGGYLLFLADLILFKSGIVNIGSKALVSLTYLFEKLAEKIGNGGSRFFQTETRTLRWQEIVCYYCLLIGLLLLLQHKKAIVPFSLAICVCLIQLYSFATVKTEVLFFDVGQGSAALIRTCDGLTGLADTGTGDTELSELLEKEGVKKIDFILISHGHSDHYGGLEEVLENYEPDIIFVPENSLDTYCNELAEKYNVNVCYVNQKTTYKLGKYTNLVMWEPEEDTDDLNNGSIVARLYGKWGSILLPGDAETEELQELVDKNEILQTDVLCLAHHGSKTSANEKFLYEVAPKYAIISVGYNNQYGHPSQLVLEKLADMDISDDEIYRTDNDGAVRIKFCNGIFGKEVIKIWQKKMRVG